MSRLQEFITKLGRVIIRYAESQTSDSYNTEEILAKPYPQIVEELTDLIQKAIKYETRNTVLNYIVYVINTVKPLVAKTTPLTEEETLLIKEILNNFLMTLFELLDITKSTEVQLKYNNIETTAQRFISTRSWTVSRVLSVMGKTLTDYLVNNISAKTSKEVAYYVETIIDEHQSIMLKPLLEERIKELEEIKKQQEELIAQLQQQLETELSSSQLPEMKKQLAFLEEQYNDAKQTIAGLQKVLIQLQQQLENQSSDLKEAKIQLLAAQTQYLESKQIIDKLKQENEYFQQQLQVCQSELRETKDQLNFSQEQYNKLEQIIAKLQKESSLLQHQLETKQVELQETKQQLTSSQESNLKSANTIATLQEENRQLKATRTTTPPILMPNLLLGGRSSFHGFFPNTRIFERTNDTGSQNNDSSVGSSSLNPGGSGTGTIE
ncbi:chromosome segregation protein SMC [Legionella beliardensis]|uniref:Chromosome segregation protein SMC n=1 Tax=Legionella beliardensis TaxID=91822 RepID=A0A378HZ92_9GAMM|nr:hypothetical protein [Legionella beliardensis]STX28249.1 chromosome segregation protein SMC [Legionella beliardensis]